MAHAPRGAALVRARPGGAARNGVWARPKRGGGQAELEEKQQQYDALDGMFKATSAQLRDTEACLSRTKGQLETTESVLGEVSFPAHRALGFGIPGPLRPARGRLPPPTPSTCLSSLGRPSGITLHRR